MKNSEINIVGMLETINSKEQLPAIFLSVGGQILPKGTEFQLLGVVKMKAVRSTGNPFYAVAVRLNGGNQVALSKNFFDGRYFAGKLNADNTITSELQTVETELSKSGLSIWEWIEANLDKTFVVTDGIEYKSQPFAADGTRLEVLRNRKFNTYALKA